MRLEPSKEGERKKKKERVGLFEDERVLGGMDNNSQREEKKDNNMRDDVQIGRFHVWFDDSSVR